MTGVSSYEKARETRRKNAELRKAREAEALMIRRKMAKACIQVLDDRTASSADKIKAVEVLHDLAERRWEYGKKLL